MGLDPAAVEAPPGPAWCRAWTDLVDATVRSGLGDLEIRGGVAVVALGSYARREVCPKSDVDLLLLHDGWPRPELEGLVRALCYPLWDAGLSVGHAVRAPKEAVGAAAERIDTSTALTERRLVAGDPGLLDDLSARLSRWLRRNRGRFLARLAEADIARRARAGSHAGMLEPELKDGAGGLRDVHSLRWGAAVLLGEAGLDALVGARYLGAADRHDLAVSSETLLSARCALHLTAPATGVGGDLDRLRLDRVEEAAAALGVGGEALLRDVGLAMRTVAHIHGRTWPLVLADATTRRRRRPEVEPAGDGIHVRDGLVEVVGAPSAAGDPSLPMRVVAAAARRGAHLSRPTAAWLRAEAESAGPLPWDATTRAAFLAALRAGEAALPALADADHLGVLEAYLPDWQRVRGRPQRNPFHRFDLDTHSFEAVAWLEAVARGTLDEGHAEFWEALADPDAVILGTLLHDVGKAWPGDHSVAGARVAGDWVRGMGFDAGCVEKVTTLVREHLLLPEVATRRDLDDAAEIDAVAARVGDVDTLDGLYLLSVADSRATGPAAHSPWKDGLVSQLHRRVRRRLLEGPVRSAGPSPDELVERARGLVRDPGDLDALLEGAPAEYLAVADAAQLAEHARLLCPLPGEGGLRARVRPGPTEGTALVSVVAADRPGLFAGCAGVLAGHGADVLDARAFTRDDGVALDWFVVVADGSVDWDAVSDDLRAAAAGRLDVAGLVRRRESRRDERPSRFHAAVPVEVRFEAASAPGASSAAAHWRVEVRGPDAPGVLYRLATVLSEAGLDVLGVRAATLPPEVRDVFLLSLPESPPDTHDLEARLRAAAGFPDDLLAGY